MASKKKIKLKTETFLDIKSKTEIILPDIKPKPKTIFPGMKPKTESYFPDIKPKTEKKFSDIKPKAEIFLLEIKLAIKPFPIDKPVPTLDDNLDNIDCQTEIFFDDNYQS